TSPTSPRKPPAQSRHAPPATSPSTHSGARHRSRSPPASHSATADAARTRRTPGSQKSVAPSTAPSGHSYSLPPASARKASTSTGPAHIQRHLTPYPLGNDTTRLARLKQDLALYRLTFGQPRQEDMLELHRHRGVTDPPDKVNELRIDLTPPVSTVTGGP